MAVASLHRRRSQTALKRIRGEGPGTAGSLAPMRQRRPEPTTLWTTAPSCRARAVRFPRAAEHQSHRQRSRQFRGRRSELERLIDLTVLEPTHPQLGTCWRFMGTTTPYGRIAKAQDSYTHRLGWKLLRGPIPEGRELHHRCGIYACWNPDHLELVTHAAKICGSDRTGCEPVGACNAANQQAFWERQRAR